MSIDPPAGELPASRPETGDQLILVAEDEATNRDLLRRQLALLGHTADFVNDGQAALDAVGEKSYALLLTDCHMPHMDGYELTRSIRAREAGTATCIPIIGITASMPSVEMERYTRSGMTGFLAKPISLKRLKEALNRWLRARAETGAAAAATAPPVAGQAPVPAEADLLDLSYLRSSLDEDDIAIKQVLKSYVASAGALVFDIEMAFSCRDAAAITGAAHKLKTASLVIGAHALVDLCRSLEDAGQNANWTAIEAGAPAVRTLFIGVSKKIRGG